MRFSQCESQDCATSGASCSSQLVTAERVLCLVTTYRSTGSWRGYLMLSGCEKSAGGDKEIKRKRLSSHTPIPTKEGGIQGCPVVFRQASIFCSADFWWSCLRVAGTHAAYPYRRKSARAARVRLRPSRMNSKTRLPRARSCALHVDLHVPNEVTGRHVALHQLRGGEYRYFRLRNQRAHIQLMFVPKSLKS